MGSTKTVLPPWIQASFLPFSFQLDFFFSQEEFKLYTISGIYMFSSIVKPNDGAQFFYYLSASNIIVYKVGTEILLEITEGRSCSRCDHIRLHYFTGCAEIFLLQKQWCGRILLNNSPNDCNTRKPTEQWLSRQERFWSNRPSLIDPVYSACMIQNVRDLWIWPTVSSAIAE